MSDRSLYMICVYRRFFVFKQMTSYELRISDWSSDVCSSDLRLRRRLGSSAPPPDTPLVLAAMEEQRGLLTAANAAARAIGLVPGMTVAQAQALVPDLQIQIGRASCRERVCQYV